jgi:Zn-dependent M28 family amino/carboxypeptidase
MALLDIILATTQALAGGPAVATLSPELTPREQAAAARITASELSGHIRFLSDDLLEGRFPGTRGEQLAVKYLATQLETMGYAPGATDASGKPSFLQAVPLVEHTARVPPSLTFTRGSGKVTLPTGPGVAAEVVLRSLADLERVTLERAELVYVGYGIVAPEQGWDDYRGVDVKGKVVVLTNFNPPWAGEGVRLWYGRWDYKYLEAARHGAVGALLVHTTESASYPWQVVATSNKAVGFALPKGTDADPRLPVQGWISHDAAARLFALGGHDLAQEEAAARDVTRKGARGLPLGVTTTLDMPVARRRLEAANVIGVLQGTDPTLRSEAVLYTAHHDHFGVRTPPVPDQHNVFSGALDNASGCAAGLTIARAIAATPPRRSVVVAFVTAEEQGLLGSHWLVQHSPFPPGRIAVDINLETANIHGRTSDVGFLGLGRSSVDGVVKALASAQGRTVHGDPAPGLGWFYRSDDFELARVGVPGARVMGGPTYLGRPAGWGKQQADAYFEKNYHQTTDVYPPPPATWDLTGMVEDTQLQLLIGLRLGDEPQLPAWTTGDEFEKAVAAR